MGPSAAPTRATSICDVRSFRSSEPNMASVQGIVKDCCSMASTASISSGCIGANCTSTRLGLALRFTPDSCWENVRAANCWYRGYSTRPSVGSGSRPYWSRYALPGRNAHDHTASGEAGPGLGSPEWLGPHDPAHDHSPTRRGSRARETRQYGAG